MRSVEIAKKDARAIARGHPWVYRQALTRRPKGLDTGDSVDVATPVRPFLGRGLYDADSTVAVRVFTRRDDEPIDRALFARRIESAQRLRDATGVAGRTDAYRMVNAEGDRFPGLIVDRLGDWLSVTYQTRSLEPWTDDIAAALTEAVPCEGVYLHDADGVRLLHGAPCPDGLVVREPTLRARVFPGGMGKKDEGGKTGLFADMREVRVLLAPMLAGRRVLNLFAHTGAFSAAAARAGASEVTSVDLSSPYLAVADENVELSAPGYAAHTALKRDAFDALKDFAREDRTFDAVVIDPPSFSASRRSGTFNIRDRYRPLVRSAIRVLAPDGLLVCATNFRGIKRDEFLHLIHDAADADETDLRILAVLGQADDHPVVSAFPEGAYLHVALAAVIAPPRLKWRP